MFLILACFLGYSMGYCIRRSFRRCEGCQTATTSTPLCEDCLGERSGFLGSDPGNM